MATAAQIIANRSNAAHCTGPTTQAGKQRSSENALKHGLYSARLILPNEDAAEFETLLRGLEESHKPANTTERLLVRDIAETWWRLERAKRIETSLLQAHAGSHDDLAGYLSSDRSGQYERVARHIDRLQRAWHRAIDTLRRTQNERRRAEQHDAIQRVHEATADCQRKMAESYHEIRLARQEHRSERPRKEEIGFVPSPAPATARPSRVPALTGLEPAEWRL